MTNTRFYETLDEIGSLYNQAIYIASQNQADNVVFAVSFYNVIISCLNGIDSIILTKYDYETPSTETPLTLHHLLNEMYNIASCSYEDSCTMEKCNNLRVGQPIEYNVDRIQAQAMFLSMEKLLATALWAMDIIEKKFPLEAVNA